MHSTKLYKLNCDAFLFCVCPRFNIRTTQDVANPGCSAEVTTACLIHLVEMIRERKPNATIVLNSILPRGVDSPMLLDGTDTSPLWTEILQVNQRLECFALGQPGVEFFNATEIFITKDDNSIKINESLMPDFTHPSADGYRIFGEALVEKALEILN